MSGIMHKIGETLHIGGDKKEEHKGEGQHVQAPHGDQHKAGEHGGYGHGGSAEQHKAGEHGGYGHGGSAEQHKEGGGMMDKIKGKIHGEGGEKGHGHDGEKKKKKEKKKHDDGHESSSSSDSD